MRFAFTDDQIAFRDALRDILTNICPAEVLRLCWEKSETWHRIIRPRLVEVGLLGVSLTDTWGGLGLNELDTVLLFEETGRVALPGPVVETAAVGAPLLQEIDNQALHERWLRSIVSGEAIVSLINEPGTYVLDARHADLLLLWDDASIYALKPSEVHFESQQSVDHSRRLERVVWDRQGHSALAMGSRAGALIERARQRGTLAVAAQLLGLGQTLLDKSVAYANVREQFGCPVGSFQAIKHKLADVLIALEYARPVVYRAAYSMAQQDDDMDVHVSMAKIYAGDAAEKAAQSALQVHGAMGYSYESELHLWMKRVWALTRCCGDADWHRARVEQALFFDAREVCR